ncbi:MAG: hypothetical protein GWP10_03505 [Nitrospiraceae bacterium]|nr:hypothetical protein [Nitrospiraceae bacterium]
MKLAPIDAEDLEVVTNPCDLRRDLHVFVDYVATRDVKRSTRENRLPKMHARKLARLVTDPDAAKQVETDGRARWIDHIDWLALKLGFVDYDTKGKYLGYSSAEPSYPDNYIIYQEKKYNHFIALSIQDQEQVILDTLVEDYSYSKNEFFRTGVLGRLDMFNSSGCVTGVLPLLNFAKSRKSLLDILKGCEGNIWYSVSSLVQYLKSKHPYFLIPKKPRYKYRLGSLDGRYGNFREGKNLYDRGETISANDPNAFEKVEGRYVERFLEGIPLTLGYLSVAYERGKDKDVYPSIGRLKAFKLNQEFLRFMYGDVPSPKVTIQPNFEIQVESAFYPAGIMAKLSPLADIVSVDKVSILKLKKKKVVAQLAQDESLDVIDFLKDISRQDLPQNLLAELEEWAGHSQVFTLYKGFGLLEGDENLVYAEDFILEDITPSLRIVRSPETIFARLEKQGLVPILVRHQERSLRSLPNTVQSVFSEIDKARPSRKKKKTFILRRKVNITLYFPDRSLFEKCRNALIQQRIPIEVEPSTNTISYLEQYKAMVADTLKTLKKECTIRIKDIDS